MVLHSAEMEEKTKGAFSYLLRRVSMALMILNARKAREHDAADHRQHYDEQPLSP